MKRITRILSFLIIVAALCGCNDTDDVVKIFTRNTKKMTMLLIATPTNPKEQDLWDGNNAAKEKSMELKRAQGNYELTFEHDGEDADGSIRGTFKGRAVKVALQGTWSADGKTGKMSLRLNQNINPANETDILAKTFIRSLNNVYKYQGDTESLSLFYDEKNAEKKFIGFITIKD